ncbi:MAG: hypothetical protein U5S82_06340 [Gammaproteobacteria bacterium]|nr:hypothetical protein [Gammaproteobacteria bacterium]
MNDWIHKKPNLAQWGLRETTDRAWCLVRDFSPREAASHGA